MSDTTNKAPNVPVAKFKRTKILATLGPATSNYDMVLELIKAGVNVMRLNFSHGRHEDREQQIKWIRKAAAAYGKPVAIVADMQGPKIRLGDFEGIVPVQAGKSLTLKYKADYERSGHLPTQYDLSKKVKRGERLYMYDGKVKTTVVSVKDGVVHLRAENDGILYKRKGINVPDTDFAGDVITTKDHKDLAFISTQDIDYVAMSFVQSASDIRAMRRTILNLGSSARVMAKIETKAAVENIEAITQESDAVIIARGDLAVEVPLESVPVIQRQIIDLGRQYATPTVIATQMLLSMVDAPEPTRAEVSDVATGVFLGADCLWLSDETATGKYPLESVEVMKRIILFTEKQVMEQGHRPKVAHPLTKQEAISEAIIELAARVDARAIVAETNSGATVLHIASNRPRRPIIAVTSTARVAQQLALVYGTKSYVRPDDKFAATKLTNWLQKNKVLKTGDMIVTASGQYPGVVGTTDTIKVRVLQ